MKFGNLLKKELGELITKQAIISMVFVAALYGFLGVIMGNAMDEAISSSSMTVCNQDDTEFTNNLLKSINDDERYEITFVDFESEDYAAELERLEIENAVIIPAGYADSVLVNKEPANLKYVSKMKNGGGLGSSIGTISSSDVVSTIQDFTSDEIMLKTYGLSDEEIDRIEDPTKLVEYTAMNGKTVAVSASALQAVTMIPSMMAPFVIFFLLLLASQMIMTAISTEKIDKTLETLLSTPVSRLTVLSAKMVAAVIAALMNAAVMVLGFAFYMFSMMGGMTDEITNSVNSTAAVSEALSITEAMDALGMTLSAGSYVLFGLQLFLTLAIGLAASLILGAMATDVKSVQTLLMPIMLAVLIPFFITMFTDVNELPIFLKVIVYLVPFTHTYTTLTNLMNGDMLMFWGGMLYQIVFFVLCMYFAVKMFTTDKLFTMTFATEKKNTTGGLFGKKKKDEAKS